MKKNLILVVIFLGSLLCCSRVASHISLTRKETSRLAPTLSSVPTTTKSPKPTTKPSTLSPKPTVVESPASSPQPFQRPTKSQLIEIGNSTSKVKGRPMIIDFPYATNNNFLKRSVYPSSRCFLRPDVAESVEKVNKILQKQGYGGIKLLDCYRPLSIQQTMWNLVPDNRYVADPKKGSDHNRGMAVDLTIVDLNGDELDMGTAFDEFTERAHHTYRNLSPKILKNRLVLKKAMNSVGLRHIDTEWWHYAAKGKKSSTFSWVWE